MLLKLQKKKKIKNLRDEIGGVCGFLFCIWSATQKVQPPFLILQRYSFIFPTSSLLVLLLMLVVVLKYKLLMHPVFAWI